jgi:hypothetical protein
MKIIAAAALISSSFTPIALPPLLSAAAAQSVDLGLCAIRAPTQSGWTCDQRVSSQTYYSKSEQTGDPVSGDLRTTCTDYVRTTADYVGINPNGRPTAVFTFTGVTSDDQLGSPYDGTNGGCTYPIQ